MLHGEENENALIRKLAMLTCGSKFGRVARVSVKRNIGGSGAYQEEVYAALQFAASFHCLVEEWKDCEVLKPKPKEKWIIVDKKREETKHRTEWCAETNKCRCMRCGRGSKYTKMPGKCTGAKYLSQKKKENGRSDTSEDTIW